ncbi:hypothetical protein OS493_013428 [Desmophyllum pertusum]|uniref:Uncharacterized protein n=1 Tax=Desmophyllum pertusum TaxID=174260 RepID=A0A9W9YDS8_9CNID|nr:hypothetical protein OS493_013428 [Desmophyllum pertusum]
MVGVAKKEHSKYASSQRKTGGGEKPASPKSAIKRLIELFGDDPAFSGISGGVESETDSNPSTSTAQETILIFAEPEIGSATEPQLQCSLPQVPLDGGVDSSLVQMQDPVLLLPTLSQSTRFSQLDHHKRLQQAKKKEGNH